jgi:predicted HicB family RNase H-like nuclease
MRSTTQIMLRVSPELAKALKLAAAAQFNTITNRVESVNTLVTKYIENGLTVEGKMHEEVRKLLATHFGSPNG